MSSEDTDSLLEQIEDLGGIGEGIVVAPCPNCRDDIIVMWAGVGGDSLPAGDMIPGKRYYVSYKKGGGECPTCGLEATPVLTTIFRLDSP